MQTKPATTAKATLTLKYKPLKFLIRENAFSCAERCTKAHGVILGDDQRFWVVCMADFDRLIRAGYEAAL